MANNLSNIEKSDLTKYIPPKGDFTRFTSDEDYLEKGQLWGLFNKNPKYEFLFKGQDYQRIVKLVGYETYGVTGEYHTIIIEFEDGNLSCIHPAYLKEMQSSTFKKVYIVDEEASKTASNRSKTKEVKGTTKAEAKEKKESKTIVLPTDKSHFNGTVKEFSTKYNHFNDSEEEIVIWENVIVKGGNELLIGDAWCSLSKSLKALELELGKSYQFDGKVVDKKLNKDVKYKLNNPSKVAML